jgi:hypothetical protein
VQLTRKITALLAVFACLMGAQTYRPANGVYTNVLRARQFVLTSLTACVSSPCVAETSDSYIGAAVNGVASAGTVTVGTNPITLTVVDGNSVAWSAAAFAAATSGTVVYPLGALTGLYLAAGFSVSCSDTSSGAGCAAAKLQVVYQR